MAVSRHLGFYRTANSAIRCADPENPSLEPNTEWIRCTVSKIFAFKLYGDLEIGIRCHSRSSKVAPFDRAHTTLYSSSIVTNAPIYYRFQDSRILVENCYPQLYLEPPLGVKPSDLRNDPWWRKTIMLVLSDGERISMMRSAVLIQYTRVTDRRTELALHIRTIACCRA